MYAFSRPRSWTLVRWWHHQIPTLFFKEAAPDGFKLAKGSTHIVVSRAFVEYVMTNQSAKHLLEWMHDIRIPDEQYFNTLSHNPQLNIPGAYIGKSYLLYNQFLFRAPLDRSIK